MQTCIDLIRYAYNLPSWWLIAILFAFVVVLMGLFFFGFFVSCLPASLRPALTIFFLLSLVAVAAGLLGMGGMIFARMVGAVMAACKYWEANGNPSTDVTGGVLGLGFVAVMFHCLLRLLAPSNVRKLWRGEAPSL